MSNAFGDHFSATVPPLEASILPLCYKNQIRAYARLLIRSGLNVQPGQLVQLGGDISQTPFLSLLKEEAYLAGAMYVYLTLHDVRDDWMRLQLQSKEELAYYPEDLIARHDLLVQEKGANLRLLSNECIELLEKSDPKKINHLYSSKRAALKNFYQKGIGESYVQWTVAAVPSVDWGRAIGFTGSDQEVYEAFWKEILYICRCLEGDSVDAWKLHDQKLHKRSTLLNNLQITELHFVGEGTDLRVGLPKEARWFGGSHQSKRDCPFQANIPTEECFTCPNCWQVNGTMRAVRPVEINGKMVHGIELTFKEGKLESFKAESGRDHFAAYIDTDAGGRYLGEVALVGIDSLIYQTGRVYQEILFDENAACHVAVGSSYEFCFEGASELEEEKLRQAGLNRSNIHTDIMLSNEKTRVTAIGPTGEHLLIDKGFWVV